jgi:hypothetical protein
MDTHESFRCRSNYWRHNNISPVDVMKYISHLGTFKHKIIVDLSAMRQIIHQHLKYSHDYSEKIKNYQSKYKCITQGHHHRNKPIHARPIKSIITELDHHHQLISALSNPLRTMAHHDCSYSHTECFCLASMA